VVKHERALERLRGRRLHQRRLQRGEPGPAHLVRTALSR
jgi:hypothetical protein